MQPANQRQSSVQIDLESDDNEDIQMINPQPSQSRPSTNQQMMVAVPQNLTQQQTLLPVNAPKNMNRRLMIERVTLENFKSYYGKKEIGPLHKCFTAVVGPNGSGKSNLIECLLFVFGKRAKRMRLNKLSELIHNSAQHKDCSHATVKVFFQDIYDDENEPDYYEVVPGTQFEISRSVNRSSQSTYRINGNEVSFKEVCELLSSKGIDLEHNRFLILQGEVEQISLMKAKAQNENETGLLEYLEDIIGSNKHVGRITELEKEIEVKDDERREKLSRVNASKHELQSLETEKNTAIEYLKKERNLMLLRNMDLFCELGDGVAKLNNSITAIEAKKATAREVKDNKKKLMEENQGLVQEIRVLMATEDKASVRQEQLTNEFRVLEKSDIQLRNDMKHNLSKVHKAKEAITEIEAKKQRLVKENLENDRILPEKEKELESQNIEKVKAEQDFERHEEKVRQTTEQLRRDKETLESQLNPMVNQFNKTKQSIDNKKQDIIQIEGKSQKIRAEIEAIRNHIVLNQNKVKAAQEDVYQLKNQIQQAEASCQQSDQKLKTISEEQSVKERELQKCRESLNQMKAAQAELRNKNNLSTSLLKAQKDGILQGIFGRLGDLGTIEQKYDCAVTTSCGVLDHIVVDNIVTGEKCIQFLRDHKIGTGKFICLDKIAQSNRQQREKAFQPPEGSLRLYDLIKITDEKFKDAFYFGLKDTLVCDGIDLATRIAYDQVRHRVVTLKGELIEKSGTMSGGGKPRTGGMSNVLVQEFSDEEIKESENLFQSLIQQIQSLRDQKPIEEDNKRKNTQNITQWNLKCQKAHMEFTQLQQGMNHLETRHVSFVKELEKSQEDEQRIVTLRSEMEEEASILTDLTPKIDEIRKAIRQQESKILESGGQEYKQKKDQMDRMVQVCSHIEKQITRMKTNLQNTESILLRHDKEIEKENVEIAKLEKANQKLNEEIQKNTSLGEKLLTEMGAIEEDKKANREKLDTQRNLFNSLKRELTKVEDEEAKAKILVEDAIKLRNQLDDQCKKIKSRIKENRDKFNGLEREFGFVFRDDMLGEEENKLAIVIQDGQVVATSSQRYSRVTNNHTQQQQEDESQNPSKRLRGPTSGFEHHLQHTAITYNFNEDEINMLTSQRGEIQQRMAALDRSLQNENPNINIIQQYRAKLLDFKEKDGRLKEVEKVFGTMKDEHHMLKKKRHDEFMQGFGIISQKLKEMYRLITNGGDAELEALDALDPFSEGIQFHVRPLKKSWKQMSKLSGGEKTISSLSLIFALHHYKPSPLYCMDEIDAALDYKNVAIVGDYIKKRARNSQFLIISLRNNMFELAEKLVGIYKTFDITKTVTINPNKLKAKIMNEEQGNNENEENQQPNRAGDNQMQITT